MYDVLEAARAAGHLPGRFYAITDTDDDEVRDGPGKRYQWDAYHIENYLLEPHYLFSALRAVGVGVKIIADESQVADKLRDCASRTIPSLVTHRLRGYVNNLVVSSINWGFEPSRKDVAVALAEALARIKNRIETLSNSSLASHALVDLQQQYENECEASLREGTWISKFRGRDILKNFCSEIVPGMRYELFRDLVITRMSEDGYHPLGMARIVNSILSD